MHPMVGRLDLGLWICSWRSFGLVKGAGAFRRFCWIRSGSRGLGMCMCRRRCGGQDHPLRPIRA